ncbi:SpoIIE family protein phosphatase [Streptomyces sp. NBC_01433]|uniref:SpoIIE family protein phosphatase n=1 Tax=Streptomyces sp. NBC_01433 TaxID=2903864 RepID=UPI00224DD48F|nr:SpoIIE family protein phosphatase [Streptomyces sp. NBC_01433]MCX4675027.1 SpoIIE family protein phosphatase [Streptomyces sp. NBC_01433]
MDAALLDALFAQSAVGLIVLDPDLRVLRANSLVDAAHVREMIGDHFTDVYRLDRPDRVAEVLRGVLDGEGPVHGRPVRGRLRRLPGPDRSFKVSAYRLDGPGDRPLGLLAAVVDVTGRERARCREECLAAVREAVGGSLDVADTCRALVGALVPGFADLAVVEVVDDVLRGAEPPVGPLGPDVPLRRADPDGGTRHLPFRTPYALAVSDLRPRLVQLTPDTAWLDADPDSARLIRSTGAHSLIAVPLTLRGAVLGLVSLYRCGDTEPYGEDDVSLARTAATRTALSIDNARRYERDHVIASTVQRRLLPQDDGDQAAVETAHVLLPGHDSGCWFDTIALSGARTALVVGSVAGQGLQTAIAMGQLRTVIQALAGLDLEPDEMLARLNDTAERLAVERAALPRADALHSEPLAAACVYGVYDPFTRTCTLARAGNPAPVVVAPDGSARPLDVPEGPSLFSADSAPFATATITLEEGSLLAFCTEALLPDAEAAARIGEALAEPGRGLRDLCDAVVYGLPAGSRPDGAALLLVRTGTVPANRVATWDLAHDRTTPATARVLVRDRLQGWNLDEDTIDATELIVSELVTNAVRYGTPPLRLRLLLGATLTCEVHDSSEVAPHLRHARTADEGGRGLFIVSQLATHWGTRHGPQGKTLWTEQDLPLPPGRAGAGRGRPQGE